MISFSVVRCNQLVLRRLLPLLSAILISPMSVMSDGWLLNSRDFFDEVSLSLMREASSSMGV